MKLVSAPLCVGIDKDVASQILEGIPEQLGVPSSGLQPAQ